MTRKDYELIAETIKTTGPIDVLTGRDVAVALSYALHADNPRFDPDRFLNACGVPS